MLGRLGIKFIHIGVIQSTDDVGAEALAGTARGTPARTLRSDSDAVVDIAVISGIGRDTVGASTGLLEDEFFLVSVHSLMT